MYFNKLMMGSYELQKVADNIRNVMAEKREGRIMVQMHNRAEYFNYKTSGMSLKQKDLYREKMKPLVIVETKIETEYSYY